MAKFKKQLYGINLPTFEKQIAAKYLNPAKLDCKTVSDGIILPLRKTELPATDGIYEGGVCDTDFNFIAGYKRIDNGRPNNFECIRSYKPSAEVEVCDEEVVFAGITFAHFGHFLVETFNRLWWVIQNQAFDKKLFFSKTRRLILIF
ncbi:hypothetical protein J2T38_001656 [Neisseria perflava]|uniref:hypothetical protein n=1 Tax=Neisseria perflava TaxID=33053 RepID=UPI0020A0EE83|nr:hypothetical protein [Neisseria perflava]MCP1772820.1 hypothetical protein [Neisseria perflava]